MGKIKIMATREEAVTAAAPPPPRPGFLMTPSSRRKAPTKSEGFSERLALARPFVTPPTD